MEKKCGLSYWQFLQGLHVLTFENQKKRFFQVFTGFFRPQKKVFSGFSWVIYCNLFSSNSNILHVQVATTAVKKNALHLLNNALHTAHCTPKSIVYQTFERIEEK